MRMMNAMRVAAGLALACFQAVASAQAWPTKAVRIIVPFSPGGIADNSARTVADKLTARLGQSVVVDNRPGAAGNIGAEWQSISACLTMSWRATG